MYFYVQNWRDPSLTDGSVLVLNLIFYFYCQSVTVLVRLRVSSESSARLRPGFWPLAELRHFMSNLFSLLITYFSEHVSVFLLVFTCGTEYLQRSLHVVFIREGFKDKQSWKCFKIIHLHGFFFASNHTNIILI